MLAPDTFSHAHIAATAATTGVISAAAGVWRFTGSATRRVVTGIAVGVVTSLAVYLWRASANMPQLNNDGLPGYSANDWLAPAIVFVALSVYADMFPPPDARRFGQVRAAATIVALAVNVVTI